MNSKFHDDIEAERESKGIEVEQARDALEEFTGTNCTAPLSLGHKVVGLYFEKLKKLQDHFNKTMDEHIYLMKKVDGTNWR